MALVNPITPGYNPQTLQDVLSQSAGSQSANLTDQYQQARKQAISDQASSGRLMSGVSNYPLTDLDTQYQSGLSGIQGNLASQEGSIPEEDWLNTQQFGRSQDLASQIANELKPSDLQQIFQGIGTGASVIGAGAALFA
jgi:hypothetical protein